MKSENHETGNLEKLKICEKCSFLGWLGKRENEGFWRGWGEKWGFGGRKQGTTALY
jgi:hypothetical protein